VAEPLCVWDAGVELGEGPVWWDGALWFVDIKGCRIHRYEPGTGAGRSWEVPEQVGFVVPATSGNFVAGLASGLHLFDPTTGVFEPIAAVEADLPGNRLNDGASDPAGRLWFGTMDDSEEEATGRYYHFDRGRLSDAGMDPVCITNGPAISPDGRLLYHVDTTRGAILVADLAEDGKLGASRLFARVEEGDGHPDGPTVDAEGCLWIGMFGGWAARRYSPQGVLLETVRFPVANVTKLAFGGADLRTVYATTARKGLSEEELAGQPLAGALFALRASVPGVTVTPVALG
jgi:xylono-1,5-lactonase